MTGIAQAVPYGMSGFSTSSGSSFAKRLMVFTPAAVQRTFSTIPVSFSYRGRTFLCRLGTGGGVIVSEKPTFRELARTGEDNRLVLLAFASSMIGFRVNGNEPNPKEPTISVYGNGSSEQATTANRPGWVA